MVLMVSCKLTLLLSAIKLFPTSLMETQIVPDFREAC